MAAIQDGVVSSDHFANMVAKCCHDHYLSLPKTGKPKVGAEWTALSGIIREDVKNYGKGCWLEVVSLGTGSKCLGHTAMSPIGDILNDSHAEVMARRGFLRYLYCELLSVFKGKQSLIVSSPGNDGKCKIKDGIKFHFYTSHTPCGDASIIPKGMASDDSIGIPLPKNVINPSSISCGMGVMVGENCGTILDHPNISRESQDNGTSEKLKEGSDVKMPSIMDHEDEPTQTSNLAVQTGSKRKYSESKEGEMASKKCRYLGYKVEDIHRTGAKCVPLSDVSDPHLPGALYHVLGVIRYKPGRGEQTHSLSCSDKLARWCSVGIEGALLSQFFSDPIPISTIVVGGGCPYSQEAMQRAIIDRVLLPRDGNMRVLHQLPVIVQSSLIFPHGRYSSEGMMVQLKPCPSSIVWSRVEKNAFEVAVNGRKQGVTKKALGTPAGRLKICKRELLNLFFDACEAKHITDYQVSENGNISRDSTYFDLKNLGQNYYQAWKTVCQGSFQSWPSKCKSLFEFTCDS